MRTIKFRGREIMYGRTLIGDLQRESKLDMIRYNGICETVHKDSVAQYAATDCSGKELYTGDMVVDENGSEFKVELVPAVRRGNRLIELDEKSRPLFRLKRVTT